MSESESGWRKIDKQELKTASPDIIFGVDSDFEEHVGSLEEACNTNDLDTIRELLNNNKFVENIVIRKGEKKEWLHLLERAVNAAAQTEIGKDFNAILNAKELTQVIESGKLSPFAGAELAGSLYHLDRDDECQRLAKLISGPETSAIDVVTKANAFNTLGSLYLRQGNVKASLDANKAGLELLAKAESGDQNSKWQINKLKYGVLVDRMTRKVHSDMPEQFFALRREREVLGDTFHLGRTDLDAARAFAMLKKKDQAIHYAQRARDIMNEQGYWSGAVQAEELLGQLKQKN